MSSIARGGIALVPSTSVAMFAVRSWPLPVPRPSVQHASVKIVDAVGDLALAGGPLLGTYRSVRGGHKLNHAVLCALMSDAAAWTWVDADTLRAPARGHADVAVGR